MCFIYSGIEEWEGRYSRIEGEENVFHIRWFEIRGVWWLFIVKKRNGNNIIYHADCSESIRNLVKAVNYVKTIINGQPGGSFVINEFGQVIVPADNGQDRYLVGEITRDCNCNYQFSNGQENISLAEVADLTIGDIWDRPYIGIPYNLSYSNQIYFQRQTDYGQIIERLNNNYEELIENLRILRPHGGLRFIVNPWGIVLTKIPNGQAWVPVFVQTLDYNNWFHKEE